MLGMARAIEVKVLVSRFIENRSETIADTLLDRLMQHANSIVRSVVARRVRCAGKSGQYESVEESEADLVQSQALGLVVEELRKARQSGDREAIRHFGAFVCHLTEHAIAQWLDQKYPERRRLKYRVRYALERRPEMACWTGASGRLLAGLVGWKVSGRETENSPALERLRKNPLDTAYAALPDAHPTTAKLVLLIYRLLQHVGHPVELETLVNAVMEIQSIHEQTRSVEENSEGEEGAGDFYSRVRDERQDTASTVQQKEFLRQVWAEIRRLNLAQRAAILLNARDHTGSSIVHLLAELQIVSLRTIADSLEMPWEEFSQTWASLPLEDRQIAALLNITKGNLRVKRSEARSRLQQRLGGSI